MEYLQFNIGYMGKNEEKVRQLFERALATVGMHVMKGAIIWEAYREYENMILTSLLLSVRIAEVETQKNKKLFPEIVFFFFFFYIIILKFTFLG